MASGSSSGPSPVPSSATRMRVRPPPSACTSTLAAPPAPPGPAANPDPDAVLVAELVVVGRDRGPAWWTVSNGTSTVYVLGAPSLAPKRTNWDTTTLDRRLKGASLVILPFQDVKVHFKSSIGAAWNLMRLRSARPFEDSLDPAM